MQDTFREIVTDRADCEVLDIIFGRHLRYVVGNERRWCRNKPKLSTDRESVVPVQFTGNYGRGEVVAFHFPWYNKDHVVLLSFKLGLIYNSH